MYIYIYVHTCLNIYILVFVCLCASIYINIINIPYFIRAYIRNVLFYLVIHFYL